MTSRARYTRRSALQAGAAIACAPFFTSARAAVDLRLTHPADPTHPVHVEAEKMAQRIGDRTNGGVKITLFPNNALGSPVETAQPRAHLLQHPAMITGKAFRGAMKYFCSSQKTCESQRP